MAKSSKASKTTFKQVRGIPRGSSKVPPKRASLANVVRTQRGAIPRGKRGV